MKIISVVGARPNFMKVAPIFRGINERRKTLEARRKTLEEIIIRQSAIVGGQKEDKQSTKNQAPDSGSPTKIGAGSSGMTIPSNLNPTLYSQSPITHLICHTGQHYDEKMSKVFFDELELPKPDFYLGVGGGSHAEQTARIMIEFEKVLLEEKPNLVIVVGDVNSTIACSLTAVKLGIKVAHIEAGLRSFDRSMPEEINRILTDSISDYLFVTEKSGLENLEHEGINRSKVHFVGNVMIDSLAYYLPKIEKREMEDAGDEKKNTSTPPIDRGKRLSMTNEMKKLNSQQSTNFSKTTKLVPGITNYFHPTTNYILVTMHRPSNVDDRDRLAELLKMLNRMAEKRKVLFPVHPRTRNNIEKFELSSEISGNLIITEPIGYLDFISLIKNAEVILTDSGGIQEESTYLGVQCVTLRPSTERPVTVEIGTNHLVGDSFVEAERVVYEILSGQKKKGKIPELWDGKAAERIIQVITGSGLE
jgi:UDP-N-acetylglucosamine 2-epimerase (non-hydrolysing)